MKRDHLQIKPTEWLSDSNLRLCSHTLRGIWLDVMCLLHGQDECGVIRRPLVDIAQAVNCTEFALKELLAMGVMRGADVGEVVPAFVYSPRHGRRLGAPVTLIDEQAGPVFYSAQMVKDEYVREKRSTSGPETASAERLKLRARVLAKTGGCCHHCAVVLTDEWHIDHLMPRSKGGRDTIENMVPSCAPCNLAKSDSHPEDWAFRKGSGNPSHNPSAKTEVTL